MRRHLPALCANTTQHSAIDAIKCEQFVDGDRCLSKWQRAYPSPRWPITKHASDGSWCPMKVDRAYWYICSPSMNARLKPATMAPTCYLVRTRTRHPADTKKTALTVNTAEGPGNVYRRIVDKSRGSPERSAISFLRACCWPHAHR